MGGPQSSKKLTSAENIVGVEPAFDRAHFLDISALVLQREISHFSLTQAMLRRNRAAEVRGIARKDVYVDARVADMFKRSHTCRGIRLPDSSCILFG